MSHSILRTPLLACAALAAVAAPAHAQQQVADEPVGRIVAVAGDSAVFNYELDLRLFSLPQELPPEGAERDRFRRAILDQIVDELLLVQAALRDTTIFVAEADLAREADATIAQEQARVGGPEVFGQQLEEAGFTVEAFRQMRISQLRKEQLISQYLGRMRQSRTPPPVSESELREIYQAQLAAGSIPPRPARITFDHIVMPTASSDTAWSRALEEARTVVAQARAGEDWATLVRRHSDEAGAGAREGTLGWFRRGDMVRAFEQAVYDRSLSPGDIIGPVESPFGLHVIRLERIRGPERQASHILIQPTINDEDRERARETASAVTDSLRAGTSLSGLQDRHHDASEDRRLGPWPRDSLPAAYGTALAGADEGDVVGPIRVEDERMGTRWVVTRVVDVDEAGQYTFEDVRAQLEQPLQQRRLFEEIVAELRRRMYVDIRLR